MNWWNPLDAINSVANSVADAVETTINQAEDFAISATSTVMEPVKDIAEQVETNFDQFVESTTTVVADFNEAAHSWMGNAWNQAANVTTDVVEFTSSSIGQAADSLPTSWEPPESATASLYDSAVTVIEQAVDPAQRAVETFVEDAGNIAEVGLQQASTIVENIEKGIEQGIQTTSTGVQQVQEMTNEVVQNAAHTIEDLVENVAEGSATVINTTQEIVDAASNALAEITDDATQSTQSLMKESMELVADWKQESVDWTVNSMMATSQFPPFDRYNSIDGQDNLSRIMYDFANASGEVWNNLSDSFASRWQDTTDWYSQNKDAVHTGLDIVGFIPGFGEAADGINALLYLSEGDHIQAGLSAAALIPVAGIAATGGKYLVKYSDEALAITKHIDDALPLGDNFVEETTDISDDIVRNYSRDQHGLSRTVLSSEAGEVMYEIDSLGRTTYAEGVISGNFSKRGKAPDPIADRLKGDDRGHLIPVGCVDDQPLVDQWINIIPENLGVNRGAKRSLEKFACELASQHPGSVVKTIHQPLYSGFDTRPYAVVHSVEKDGKIVKQETFHNSQYKKP